MQVGLKLLLEDASDYNALTKALELHYLYEESYCDYFFDFPNQTLTAMGSLLRLRVPCHKPNSTAQFFPACGGCPVGCASAGEPLSTNGTTGISVSYEDFLSSCQGSDFVEDQKKLQEQQWAAAASVRRVPSSKGKENATDTVFPTNVNEDRIVAALIPEAYGRLTLKQNNVVEDGEQINFKQEDDQVPADVVARFLGHNVAGSGDEIAENFFTVLESYADRRQREQQEQQEQEQKLKQTGCTSVHVTDASAPPAVCIVERLRYAAYQIHQQQQRCICEIQALQAEEDECKYYGQARYATGTCSQTSVQEEARKVQSFPCELLPMGHYISTRKVYCYLQSTASFSSTRGFPREFGIGSEAPVAVAPVSEQERMWRDRLRIRIDKTLFPFGLKYELEVPYLDSALGENIMNELTTFLSRLQIKFQLGSEGKYAYFLRGMRSLRIQPQDVQEVKLRLINVNGYEEVKQNLERVIMATTATDLCDSTRDATSGCFSRADCGVMPTPHTTCTTATSDLGTGIMQQSQSLQVGHPAMSNAVLACLTKDLSIEDFTEFQENYFFDGPNDELHQQQCFLRLRRFNRTACYSLVLKERHVFKDSQQSNRTRKTDLSADIAANLIRHPEQFLCAERDRNVIARVLHDSFGLRTLVPTVCFTTTRITVPWLSAQSQRPLLTGSPMPTQTPALEVRLSQNTLSRQHYPPSAIFSSGLQSPCIAAGDAHALHGSALQTGSDTPLLIHLDRTQYSVPATTALVSRKPFQVLSHTQQAPTNFQPDSDGSGAGFYELYEIEVTNLAPGTAPKAVMEELIRVLEGLGVEWQPGIQSKLDQCFALLANAGVSLPPHMSNS